MNGWETAVLDNDVLRVLVLPGKGGEISEVWHLPSGSQLLWHAPWELRRGPRVEPGTQFDDWYAGGWQDLLPNGDAACEVGDVSHEFHGESWALPWCAVRNPNRRLGLTLTFPRDVFRWLWIWQAFGGATAAPFDERVSTLALEPWTSPPSLAAAVARGEAAVLAAGASLEAVVEATVLAGTETLEPPSAAETPVTNEREDA